ncbi:MAG TPA: hypothetical protein VFU48_02030, partial [Nitrospira sp.]|nr:hypothetical protein [Nitrospira sp.]
MEQDSTSQRQDIASLQQERSRCDVQEASTEPCQGDADSSVRAALARHIRAEAELKEQLAEATARIAFLEEDPSPPLGAPVAPQWVHGRLRRAVERIRVVFSRLEFLDDAIERYQDALLLAQRTLNDLTTEWDLGGSIQDQLDLAVTAEETL